MAKRQNGFGKTKSFAFKGLAPINVGKKGQNAGLAPSVRSFGTTVKKSIIQKYNLNSDWVKWRKGYEYYNRAAWYELETYDNLTEQYSRTSLDSKLYQGTPNEVDVTFEGYKFATKNSDSNNHYVMKRKSTSNVNIGTISSVQNNPYLHLLNQQNKEIWCEFTSGPNYEILLQMIGERIDDSETEATISYLLNSSKYPAIYIGKSSSPSTTVEVTIPLADLTYQSNVEPIQDYNSLIDQIVYIPSFFVNKNKTQIDSLNWTDGVETFTVALEDTASNQSLEILNRNTNELPPSLLDITSLANTVSTANATYTVKGEFLFNKPNYQRFFGKQYLTADLVDLNTDKAAYTIMPFSILGVEVSGGNLILKSVPARTELKITSDPTNGTIIFTDYSFTKISTDTYSGQYYHVDDIADEQWLLLDTDVDPWMDEVFTKGIPLKPSTVFACSCPNYSQAILSAPQSTQDSGTRKINRQRRYPLPTAMSPDDFSVEGRNQAAGKTTSWEKREHRMKFKMCKHTIAARFIERIKTKEPNDYPTIESREQFNEKLDSEMNEVGNRFVESYKRGGITTLELIFALGQGLNLDDVEMAYVIFGTNY
tara:strand:- start:1422 stop:3206 length:1785 start_codon:yes stop_codon:yes gene_type:complete